MKRKYLILFSLSGLILCCDQVTKYIVNLSVKEGAVIELIPWVVRITFTKNTGFAFGMLRSLPTNLQHIFFIGIPVFALLLIILIFIKLQDNEMVSSVALTTILAGAVGNLVDRIQYGYVIDFVQIHWKNMFTSPAFNVADLSIMIGVTIMFLNTLLNPGVKNRAKA